jgi:hypothetical protein
MLPLNMTIADAERTEGIGEKVLYNWRSKAVEQGGSVLGKRWNVSPLELI